MCAPWELSRDDERQIDMRPRWLACVAGAVLAGLGAPACGDEPEAVAPLARTPGLGAPAVWTPDPGNPPSPDRSTFTALVTRLGCNDGTTGRVGTPGVTGSETEVIVTFTVKFASEGYHACPGNDQVAVEVDLGQPLGDRVLLDGACQPSGAAVDTSFCEDPPR
jgi:hypothetical protein